MITLTTEQAQQIEEALVNLCNSIQLPTSDVKALSTIRAARAQEQAEQEPVAWVTAKESFCGFPKLVFSETQKDGYKPLYAAPVRTKDLTDAEIGTLVQRHTIDGNVMPFALCEAVIAADREKNK